MSDLIEREDAIDVVKKNHYRLEGHGLTEELLIEQMRSIPSADRPRGEWIDSEISLESGDTMPIQVCNLCKTFYPLAYTGGGHRFCPNCGADMREREGE